MTQELTKTPTPIAPPRCPECSDEGIESPVLLVEHGYHMSPVVWDDAVRDWTTNPAAWLNSWDGDESYWQCPECHWQGGDPLGLDPDED